MRSLLYVILGYVGYHQRFFNETGYLRQQSHFHKQRNEQATQVVANRQHMCSLCQTWQPLGIAELIRKVCVVCDGTGMLHVSKGMGFAFLGSNLPDSGLCC